MNFVEVSYNDAGEVPDEENIVSFAGKVLEYIGKDNWEISLVFASDGFIRDLNSRYRSKDEATDVLSFARRIQGRILKYSTRAI